MQFILFVRTAWKCGKPPKLVRFGFLIDNLDLLMSGAMPDYLLQIPDWAWWCSVIFWTGFKLKNQPVNLKFQDAGITESVHFLSSSLGFVLRSEIFKRSFVKISLCTLLKMVEQTVVTLQPSPWIFALPERRVHEVENLNVISMAWNCQMIPEKVSLTVPQILKVSLLVS